MLPNSPDVEQVALGPDGILEGARSGLLYADMSTISPLVSQKVGKALAARGVRVLDAPVSGGEKGAIDAALSIMVGGDKADFEAALPIFQAMGKTITHLGPLGAGGFTKLANQIIVAVNLTALGEALTLARKAGLDRELTLKALAGGLAGSKCLEQKAPNYIAGTYKPGFKIDLHFKDLGLIMESSRALGVPLPATAVVQELFNAMRVKGKGGLDHSGVITLLEELAGLPDPNESHRRPARPRLPGSLAPHQDPAGPEGRPLQGPGRDRAVLRRLLQRQMGTRPRQVFGGAQYVITAGSWSPGAASWPRRATARSSAPRWR